MPVSTTKVAQALGCTGQTVRQLIRQGRLPATRLGGRVKGQYRIRVEDVRKWMEEHAYVPEAINVLGDEKANG